MNKACIYCKQIFQLFLVIINFIEDNLDPNIDYIDITED